MQPEDLDGDNMYRCPSCDQLRRAIRTMKPTHFPPVLHFALNRFVYDVEIGDRKKVKAGILYPNAIRLGGHDYELRGVITHQGAHVGVSALSR